MKKVVFVVVMVFLLLIISGCIYNPTLDDPDYINYGGFRIPKADGNSKLCDNTNDNYDFFTIPSKNYCILSGNKSSCKLMGNSLFTWTSVPLIKYDKDVCVPVCETNNDCNGGSHEKCLSIPEWDIKMCTPYCNDNNDCLPGLTECTNGICTTLKTLNKPGESCGGNQQVVWSYVLPDEEEIFNEGKVPTRIGCCEADQCITGNGDCVDFDDLPESNSFSTCGFDNDWKICRNSIPNIFSDGANFFCGEKDSEYQWIPVEKSCSDNSDDNDWNKADCLDPSCNGRLGVSTSPDELTGNIVLDINAFKGKLISKLGSQQQPFVPTPGPNKCEYQKEITCNDGFDNDGDTKVNQQPSHQLVQQIVQQGISITFCNNNGTCDNGETPQNCPKDCKPQINLPEQKKPVINPKTGPIQKQQPQFVKNIYGGAVGLTKDFSLWDKIKRILWGDKNAKVGHAYGLKGSLQIPKTVQFNPQVAQQGNVLPENQNQPSNVPSPSQSITNNVPPGTAGTDCYDSDCVGKTGPEGANCCMSDSDCGSGAVCTTNNECLETTCSDGLDNDGDGLSDCLDSDCNNLKCGGTDKNPSVCYKKNCTALPEAPSASIPKQAVVEIFSYDDILDLLNKCKIVNNVGVGNDVCNAVGKTCISFANDCRENGDKFTCC